MIKAARLPSGILRMVRHGDELVAALRAMRNTSVLSNREHLKLAGDWLLFAQSVKSDGGYAHSYSLHQGWERSYPETTGYIIPTMIKLGDHLKDDRYKASALNAGAWLLSMQRPDGSFPDLEGRPQVFDTGQIIEGLLALSATTHDAAYLTAASRAGEFLIGCQDPDGSWTSFSYHRLPHTYYTRVAANLLRLSQATGKLRFATAGRKNLSWALTRKASRGFFSNMSFQADEAPILHTIIYVLEGLLDSYRLDNDEALMAALTVTTENIVAINRARDYLLFARYNEQWKAQGTEYCTVGLAQWAGLLLNLHSLKRNEEYALLAERTLSFLKSKQIRNSGANMQGSIPGSIPVWGSYFRFAFNNWTIKFFIDALLLLEQTRDQDTPRR